MVLGNVRNTRAVVKIRKRTDVDVQPRSARVAGRDWVDGRLIAWPSFYQKGSSLCLHFRGFVNGQAF